MPMQGDSPRPKKEPDYKALFKAQILGIRDDTTGKRVIPYKRAQQINKKK